MADENRQTQEVVEVAGSVQIELRESQNVVEALGPLQIQIIQSQNIVESLGLVTIPLNQTQNIVEVLWIPADLSGIYWINPDKTHDSYYTNTENRIPDPVIRLALVGE